MTKAVRVENADTSSFKLRVITQMKTAEGWVDDPSAPVQDLTYPTQLATFGLTSHRRVIVEEFE